MVIAQLGAIWGGNAIYYAHFRPTMLPRIAEVAKKARAVEKVDDNYDQPHRAKPSGIAGSAARLVYYWLDYMGGYMRSVRPVLKRREVMLFDRYYYDMIADSFRSRIALPAPLLRLMGRLLPLPQHAFFIHVYPDEIFRRKQELTMERIVELNARYGALAKRGWLISIDNNGAPEIAAAAIVDTIVSARDARARKALR
jgi:thymidylate kinase